MFISGSAIFTIASDVIGFDKATQFSIGPPARNTSWKMVKTFTLALLLVVWEESLLLGADALDPSFGDTLDC